MPSNTFARDPRDRYSRQVRFAPLGEEGQRRLQEARVLVCGVGALGTVAAGTLARAGVGFLRIVDRDFIELNNLQRQVLFDEDDVAAELPKAIAAANKLRRINSSIQVEPVVADVDPDNILQMCQDVDVIVDGTDNFETRFLLNDAAVKLGKPWVYGGCLGAEGQTMTILPGRTPCLRCLMPEPPAPGTSPTCDTAGIVGSIVEVIAAIEALEAIKILSGRLDAVNPSLLVMDLWDNQVRPMRLGNLREATNCPCCVGRRFEWLDGRRASHTAVLCGRNAVQLAPLERSALSLDALAEKLAAAGTVRRNPFLLRAEIGEYLLTVFPDGRVIVGGTDDIATARTVHARYVGS